MTTIASKRTTTTACLLALALCGAAGAQPARWAEREVSFRNGAVELRGTLLLPVATAPAPAVVFLHGSGPATRDGARGHAEQFAELGVASLRFDKRGSGASGGSWTSASLDDLAGDALAAIELLKTVAEVDPRRLGFWGVSQAGWVAPRAAARSDDVAFLIVVSGGGASPLASERYSWKREFEKAGLSAAESAEAWSVLDLYFDYLATGTGRLEIVTRLDGLRAGRLRELAEVVERVLPSEENRPNWSWVATYDPATDLAKLRCPVLLLFGERDDEHPTALAVPRWREGLAQAANDGATIVVFPGADHGIRIREGHTGPGRAPRADGYDELQLGWLWRHVVARRDGPGRPPVGR